MKETEDTFKAALGSLHYVKGRPTHLHNSGFTSDF